MADGDLSSRGFLARAKERIADGNKTGLLYAALDLRMGIEARLNDYRDGAEKVATLKKRGWHIAHLAKDIERVFRTGNKVISFAIHKPDGTGTRSVLLYTPVTRRTIHLAERLGDYLHVNRRFDSGDKWWEEFRELVSEGIHGLTQATTGTLLAPPVLQKSTGQANLFVEGVEKDGVVQARTPVGIPGETVKVTVAYFDDIPAPTV